MEKIYTVTEFAELLGKKVKTLQKWDRDGVLKAYRTPTNRRYYTEAQYYEYTGQSLKKENEVREQVIYARVSSQSQKHDLINQIEFLKSYSVNNGISISNIYTDIGSGLNYKRKNWMRLIDDCFQGKISKIYVSYSDRFVRFGFEWIQTILKTYTNTEIIVVENTLLTPEEEVIQDLITIIHVFSSRVYGLRKYKKKIEKELDNDNIIQN